MDFRIKDGLFCRFLRLVHIHEEQSSRVQSHFHVLVDSSPSSGDALTKIFKLLDNYKAAPGIGQDDSPIRVYSRVYVKPELNASSD